MSDPVRAVERSLDILLCFTVQTPELSMTEIATQVDLHKSTAHRLLATLESKRFVQRDPNTGLYSLGLRLVRLIHVTLNHDDLLQLSIPHLRRLNESFEENVHLTVLDETSVVYVHLIEGHRRVKLAAALGQSLPAHATASGKAILAFLPDAELLEILAKGMHKYTQRTIQSVDEFIKDRGRILDRGYAVSEQEYENDINALAAPVLNTDPYPLASISIAGPAYRLPMERIQEIAPSLLSTVHELSQEISKAVPPNIDLTEKTIATARNSI
ncbi:MAG: IclR family transcriptional regulator [Anaerolineales bacterium]|nr:MAG: IclR family transcriptional regulator [Anaerolineales bacterium]